MHAHFDLVAVLFTDGKQLDAVVQQLRRLKVRTGQLGNPFAVDHLNGHMRMERHRREDREFVHRVIALYVRRGVRFGIAKRLRLFQRVLKALTALGHLREDVVRRAVDNAHHTGDVVGLHGIEYCADDRDAAANRRLEVQPRAGGFRRLFKRGPVLAHDFLVGGHNRLARLQRADDKRLRRFDAAHALDHNVDGWIVDDLVKRRGEERTRREIQIRFVFKVPH